MLSLAIALFLCSGCSSEPDRDTASTSGTLTIEFWHYMAGPHGEAVDSLLRKFESENPGIKVRGVFQGNPNSLKQKLDGSFAAGAQFAPTVSLVYENWTDDFLARNYMDPVSNYIDGTHGLPEGDIDDFVSVFREGNTWDGNLITLPFNKSIYLFHLNMDKLQAAGLTTAPKTQADLADMIRTTTEKRGSRTISYGLGVIPKGEALTTLMVAAGGKFLDTNNRPVLNSPEALNALNFLRSLQHPDPFLYVNTDYMSIPFSNSLITSFIYSSASLPYNEEGSRDKFEYKTAPVPGVDGQEARYLLQGTNIGIFSPKSPEEREAGWKLIRFLTTAENGAYFCSRSGYMPYRYSMIEQPELKSFMERNPNYALGARLVLEDKGIQEPRHRGWEGIRLEYDRIVDLVLSRPDTDPKALLDALQQQAEQRMN